MVTARMDVSQMPRYGSNKTVNTDGITFFGNCLMKLDWWNNFIVIKMVPKKSDADMTQQGFSGIPGGTYDFLNRIQITVSSQNASILGHWLEREFLPACREQKEAHLGVICSLKHIFYIDSFLDGKFNPHVTVYADITQNSIPAKMMTYFFEKLKAITYYNHETGEMVVDESILYNIEYLADMFKTSALVLSGGIGHGAAYGTADSKLQMDNYFRQSAQKQGFIYEGPHEFHSRMEKNDAAGTGFVNNVTRPQLTQSNTNVSTASSIDDLSSLM